MAAEFPELGDELDKQSWDWLDVNHPTIAAAVNVTTNRGATPEGIYKFVMKQTGREEFARRCEAASRHLLAVKK